MNRHYVSKFYLRGWTNNDLIDCYRWNNKDKKIIRFYQIPDNVAYIKDAWDDSIEKEIKLIEDKSSKSVKRIIEKKQIKSEDYDNIKRLAYLYRVLSLKSCAYLYEYCGKKELDDLIKSEIIQKHISSIEDGTRITVSGRTIVFEKKDGWMHIYAFSKLPEIYKENIKNFLSNEEFFKFFGNIKLKIFYYNCDSILTSDNPCVLLGLWPNYFKTTYWFSCTENYNLFLPISSNCLVFGQYGAKNINNVDENKIKDICNKATIENSMDFIFSKNKIKEDLLELWQYRKLNHPMPNAKEIVKIRISDEDIIKKAKGVS